MRVLSVFYMIGIIIIHATAFCIALVLSLKIIFEFVIGVAQGLAESVGNGLGWLIDQIDYRIRKRKSEKERLKYYKDHPEDMGPT